MRFGVNRAGGFLRARGGNFAVTAALSALGIILALGGAIDMGKLYRAGQIAQDAADAAVLAAAKRLETGTVAEVKAEAQLYGRSHLPPDLAAITLSEVIDQAKGTVTVTARGSVTPSFLKLARIDSLPFERRAVAVMGTKGYLDFHFLLDVSESMNIAADATERAKLEAITKVSNNRPCAFACHRHETLKPPYTTPYSVFQMNEMAGANKARLRIDVLREAADAMIDKLLEFDSDPDVLLDLRIHTAGFGSIFEKGVGPSTDAGALKNSIRGFAVGNAHTDLAKALAGLSAAMGAQGTGTSFNSYKKVALMITDGVKDIGGDFPRSKLGPIDPGECAKIKSKGIDLAVLEIKYVDDYDVGNYFRDRVSWYYRSISPNLQSCASPGLYYLAKDSGEAQAKLLALTESLVGHKMRVMR